MKMKTVLAMAAAAVVSAILVGVSSTASAESAPAGPSAEGWYHYDTAGPVPESEHPNDKNDWPRFTLGVEAYWDGSKITTVRRPTIKITNYSDREVDFLGATAARHTASTHQTASWLIEGRATLYPSPTRGGLLEPRPTMSIYPSGVCRAALPASGAQLRVNLDCTVTPVTAAR